MVLQISLDVSVLKMVAHKNDVEIKMIYDHSLSKL